MEILETIYSVFKLALIPTLFMFIGFNATRNCGKRRRYIILSIISLILTLLFVIAYVFDCVMPQSDTANYFSPFIYYVFIITCGTYFILSIILMIINFRNNEKFYKAKPVKKKMVYTVRPKEDYLYVFYRFQDHIYLLKDKKSGITYKLKKTEFSDDAIKKINNEMKVDVPDEVERNGMVTVDMGYCDNVFYCYMIDVSEEMKNDNFISIKMNEIDKVGLLDFDRFVILNCFVKTNFDERY